MTSVFERYLTLWVGLCIVSGIGLGKVAPNLAKPLDGMAISVNGAPVGLTLVINWLIKPFTMYAIASFFLGTLSYQFIGSDAMDLGKMPLGADLAVEAR